MTTVPVASWRGPRLIGRDPELDVLSAFFERLADDGAALLLLGDPGVGKTALLDAAAGVAREAGVLVLRLAGVQFETTMSFAGLNQALLPLHRELIALARPHRDALNIALGFVEAGAPDPLLVSNATLALLREAARSQPVLVIVDDLQWLDRATASALGFVARRVSTGRIGVLGASRLDEQGAPVRWGIPEYELAPLDHDAATRLIGTCFPSLPARVRDRVLAEAAGNPLALLELPAGLAALRELPNVLPLGRRLESVFAARVLELPESTRRLLLLTALDGTGDLRVLESAHAQGRGLDDLAAAEAARLVSIDEATHRLVFRHPLIRSAIVGRSGHNDRRAAHRALADIVASNPDRRAWHLAEASLGPDESVAALLEQAALRILRRGDPAGAVAALTRAAALSPAGSDRSRRLAEAAYIGADMSGDIRSVSQLLADAHRADPHGVSLHAAIAAAYALLNSDGDIVMAHSVLVGAIAARREPYAPGDPALIEALHTLLYVCLWALRPELWAPFHEALARLAGEGPPESELRLEVQTRADPVRIATPAVLERLDHAIETLPKEVDLVRIDRVVRAGIDVDRTPDCRATLWSVIRDGRGGGAVTAAIFALMHLSITDFSAGLWDEAEELADEGIALSEAHGYGLLVWPFRRTQAVLAGARGDAARAFALSDAMAGWAEPRGVGLVRLYAHHARELAALGAGDFEHAYHHACEISPPGELPSHVGYALWIPLDLVEAAVRTGRTAHAAAHAAAMSDARTDAISPRLALLTHACAALAAHDDDATTLFGRALATPQAHRWPFEVARVRLAYGEHLRRIRATTDSRAELTGALETFTRLGAAPWANRAAAELRAAGPTSMRTGLRDRDALSPQEREIALLAATGLTNKQIGQRLFLSHRTVGAHLYRIYPKLGIASRAALRDALTSLPEDLPQPR